MELYRLRSYIKAPSVPLGFRIWLTIALTLLMVVLTLSIVGCKSNVLKFSVIRSTFSPTLLYVCARAGISRPIMVFKCWVVCVRSSVTCSTLLIMAGRCGLLTRRLSELTSVSSLSAIATTLGSISSALDIRPDSLLPGIVSPALYTRSVIGAGLIFMVQPPISPASRVTSVP